MSGRKDGEKLIVMSELEYSKFQHKVSKGCEGKELVDFDNGIFSLFHIVILYGFLLKAMYFDTLYFDALSFYFI